MLCASAMMAQLTVGRFESSVGKTKQPLEIVRKATLNKLTPYSYNIINTTPKGDLLTDVQWSSKACYAENGQVKWTMLSGFVPRIIVNGKKMYIQNAITQMADYGQPWIEGDISADGHTVTFHTPQAYYLNGMDMTYATRVSSTTGKPEANTDLVFSYVDGNLTQTDGGLLALTNIDGGFYGYGDMDIKVTRNTDVAVTLPAEAKPESYKMEFTRSGSKATQLAEIAFCGNDVYLSNPVGDEGSWIKGTVEGQTISFPTGQYLGSGSGYFLYLNTGRDSMYYEQNPITLSPTPVYTYAVDHAPALTFTLDAETHVLSTQQTMLITSAKDALGVAYAGYAKPVYTPWTPTLAKPAKPLITNYIDLSEYAAYGLAGMMLSFDIPAEDVDGNFIPQEMMYYTVCYDGRPQEFFGYSELPYYASATDATTQTAIQVSGITHSIQSLLVPRDSVSVQSYYVQGDVYESSDISVWVIKEGAEHTIASAIESVEPTSDSRVASVRYFDLNGRQMAAPSKSGLYIRETIYTDGTRKSVKYSR